MSVTKFIAELPSRDANNFSKLLNDFTCKTESKKPPLYISTKDHPIGQEIVTYKTIVILKYMHHHWDKKGTKSRELSPTPPEPSCKRPRMDGSGNNQPS